MTADELRYVFFNRKPVVYTYPNDEPILYECISAISYRYIAPEKAQVSVEMKCTCGHSSTDARLRYVEPAEPVPSGATAPEIEIDEKIKDLFKNGEPVSVNSPTVGKADFENIYEIIIELTDDNKAEIFCSFRIDRYHEKIIVPISCVKPKLKKKAKPINYKAIIELFKEICPELPQPQKLTDARRRAIRGAKDDGVDFGVLFRKVHQSKFLTMKCKACCFDWVLKPSNRVKILEGNYDDIIELNAPRSETSYDIDELDKIE